MAKHGECYLPWLNALDSPCHFCEHRHKGCHSECEEYKKSVNELKARKKTLNHTGADEVMIDRSKRMKSIKIKKQQKGLLKKDDG